jgi:hypothetical protein
MATQDQIYYDLQEDLSLSVLALNNARARLARTTDPAERASIERFIRDTQDYIAQLQQQLSARARQSAGETVREDQVGRAEGASVTNPPSAPLIIENDGRVTPAVSPVPSNAQRTPSAGVPDSGLDDPVRSANQIQSTPATLPDPGPVAPNQRGPVAAQNAGIAAAGDDVRASINAIFGGEAARIITQDNVLDKYASYTYTISIYLMSPEDYARLIRSKTKNLAGYNLLIQSAGIPLATGFGSPPGQADVGEVPGVTTRSQDAGRNQFFQEDFYIDDVKLRSVISGKGTGGPHNVVSMDFRIIEPNGITLLPRLYRATQQYVGGQPTADTNYAAQNYLMVIRFYGYDADGNQYVPIKGSLSDAQGNPVTTPTAIEKFIPFQFTSIKFRVADRLTEYACEAVCPQNVIATGPARGVIPYNVEITSKTLQELFSGPVAFSSPPRAGAVTAPTVRRTTATSGLGSTLDLELGVTPDTSGALPSENVAPPKANAVSTPTITQGLAEALNKYQQDLVQQGVYTIPDTYRIEILTPALQNAKVVPPGQTNQRSVPMGPGAKAPANQQKNPATQSQDKDAKNTSALAGMSIVQFIDQYTRTSTYIYDQQTKIRDPKTQKTVPNGTPAEVTAWYRVGLQAVPKSSLGEDPKRNDYAYDITYQLTPYKVNDVQSDYFPQGEFQGTHKKYNYWFTGQNTQILRFEQDFNYLYYLTVNTEQPTAATGLTTDYREKLKKSFSPRSAQSSMGQQGPTNEASANAADYLYSPADQGRIKLEILGDPSWIQQGELWAGIAGTGQIYGPFLDDGTINYEGQEALFEIAFNQPVDYNLDTGIMDPTTKNFNKTDSNAGDARQSYIYRATDVISTFSQGRFTQELNGVLILFDLTNNQTLRANQDRELAPGAATAQPTRARQLAPAPSSPLSFQDRQQQAARVVNAARREQFGRLTADPLGTVFGVPSSNNPLTSSSLEAEGFITPAQPAEPPTSSGQIIGPASNPTSIFGQYGATGIGTGSPTVTFTTQTGRVITVTSQQDITNAFNAGFINRTVANELTRQLNLQQQRANSPVNNQRPQSIVKEP